MLVELYIFFVFLGFIFEGDTMHDLLFLNSWLHFSYYFLLYILVYEQILSYMFLVVFLYALK
jgi:hypothetical protein